MTVEMGNKSGQTKGEIAMKQVTAILPCSAQAISGVPYKHWCVSTTQDLSRFSVYSTQGRELLTPKPL